MAKIENITIAPDRFFTDVKLSCCMIKECIYNERKHVIPGGDLTFQCAFKCTFINESGKCGRVVLGDMDKDYFKIKD